VATHADALIEGEGPLPEAVPDLLRYLRSYPSDPPAGAEDFLYWTVVNFGLKDTVRVNHVTIYPLEDRATGATHAIATRQLYASHYFHTTLELRFLLGDPREDDSAHTALISITRSRNDGMTGFLGVFLRPVITRRSRAGVVDYLTHVQEQVERPVADE